MDRGVGGWCASLADLYREPKTQEAWKGELVLPESGGVRELIHSKHK